MVGHEDIVNFVAFSPDGKHIVSASNDHTICVWNLETGDMALDPMKGHTDMVFSAVFSPDGRHIVSASLDKTICIWNSDTDGVRPFARPYLACVECCFLSWWMAHCVGLFWQYHLYLEFRNWQHGFGPFRMPYQFPNWWKSASIFWGWSWWQAFLYQLWNSTIHCDTTTRKLLQGTSTSSSYYFHLGGEDLAVGGVVNSGVDTWLYSNRSLRFVMGRYLGQLILKFIF